MAAGVVLVVGSSAVVVLGDVVTARRSRGPVPVHPAALWTLALAAPVTFGVFVVTNTWLGTEERLDVAREATLGRFW
jgi:hypothetical protein